MIHPPLTGLVGTRTEFFDILERKEMGFFLRKRKNFKKEKNLHVVLLKTTAVSLTW